MIHSERKQEMKNNIINEMNLRFSSNSRNESFARYSVTAFVSQLDPDTEELADIRTAVSEAVTNSIIHGYREKDGKISVDVKLYSDRSVRIRVVDKGCGIPDIKKAMQPLYSGDPDGERGGMGFTIMESFSDKLKVHSVPSRGTSVTMIKKLK